MLKVVVVRWQYLIEDNDSWSLKEKRKE